MNKPKNFSIEDCKVFNEFVDICGSNNLLFQNINFGKGETTKGESGIFFDIETSIGLSDEEAKEIFNSFIQRHPTCGITYVKREISVLEKVLQQKSFNVLGVHEGIMLEKIHLSE